MAALAPYRIDEEVGRSYRSVEGLEEAFPAGRLARQDHVAGGQVLADKHFLGVEAEYASGEVILISL